MYSFANMLPLLECAQFIVKFLCVFLFLCIILKTFAKLTTGRCKSNSYLGGKTALVTGGSTGIGYETALGLAARGCRVIIAHKNEIFNLKDEIVRKTGNSNIVIKHFDMASLKSVRDLAKDINENEERLDILINNAGTAGLKNYYTEDGLHKCMQINHFGGFLLTHLLAGLLKKSAPSRVVFVSSNAAYFNDLTLENLNHPPTVNSSPFKEARIYANTKLCNIITANVLSKKLKGTDVTVNSLHPGLVHTKIIIKALDGLDKGNFMKTLFYDYIYWYFGKSAQEAAETVLEASISKELETVSGEYFVDCKNVSQPSKARDEEFCLKIWKASEDYVKLNEKEKL